MPSWMPGIHQYYDNVNAHVLSETSKGFWWKPVRKDSMIFICVSGVSGHSVECSVDWKCVNVIGVTQEQEFQEFNATQF